MLLNNAYELSEVGKYTEALKFYDKVLEIEPNNLGAIIDNGVTLQNLGFLRKAIEMYERALILDGENPTHDWNTFLSFDYKPYVINPETNFISSANQYTFDEKYPYYYHWFNSCL